MAAAAKSAVVHPDRGSVPTTITPPVNEGTNERGEGIAQRLASRLARSLKCLLDRLLASRPGQPEGAKPGPGYVRALRTHPSSEAAPEPRNEGVCPGLSPHRRSSQPVRSGREEGVDDARRPFPVSSTGRQ